MAEIIHQVRQEPMVEPVETADHPELRVLPERPRDTIAVLVTADPALRAIPLPWPLRTELRRILLSLRHNRGSLTYCGRAPKSYW
ncbi:hypothetical protein ACWEKT_35690 [Nocardia takedensis]